MLPTEELLKGVENREVVLRAIDLAEKSLKTWETTVTSFLSPPEWMEVSQVCQRLTEIDICCFGGYPQAERQRIAIARSEVPLDESQVNLTAIEIVGNFLFDSATHRDFLGSILGTGIVRDRVGDILVLGERGAQAIVDPELVPYLEIHLDRVRSVPVKVRTIEFGELKVREPKKKEMTTVEASLRLDAIASAGFGMSRSKLVELITSGDVRVNWKETDRPATNLKSGDSISIRGKGRLTIGEITVTKKERYRVSLTRYI
jgi:photosystem II S4 domain protein